MKDSFIIAKCLTLYTYKFQFSHFNYKILHCKSNHVDCAINPQFHKTLIVYHGKSHCR